MKIALIAAFLCLAAALPNVRQVQNLNNPNRVAGEFLVVLKPAATQAVNVQYAKSVAAKISAISSKINVVKSFTSLKHPMLFVRTSDESVMSQLFQLQEVKFIESNLYEKMINDCGSQQTTNEIWGLSRVGSRAMPDPYSSATYSYTPEDGNSVKVYVLDTSVRTTHNDFGGRAVFGYNAVGDNQNDDRNGHGTHCAGTVAGTLYGVAKQASIVAIKVLNDYGFGSTAGIIEGIEWMVQDVGQGAGVGSMSLGGGANAAMDQAVNDADAAGVPVVVAAGNSDADACLSSPARAEGAITVGSTDISDGLSSFSNWGTCVSILAPGSNIKSAWIDNDDSTANLSGTSMACPHVAGEVAAIRSANPSLLPAQVKAVLYESATIDAIDLRGTSGTPNVFQYSECLE